MSAKSSSAGATPARAYRLMPIPGAECVVLAPDSAHKWDSQTNTRGGKFNILAQYVVAQGGLIIGLPDGRHYLLRVFTEWKSLLVEPLYPAKGAAYKTRKGQHTWILSLASAAVQKQKVHPELLNIVTRMEQGKETIYFYNRDKHHTLKIDLYQAQEEESAPATEEQEDEAAAAGPPAGARILDAVRTAYASFNSPIIFFILAGAFITGALIIRGGYVREFERQTYGEPHAVLLEQQHLNVVLSDTTGAHALKSAELSYPIYQALTFAGQRHSHHVEAISVSEVEPANAQQVLVKVQMQGTDARDFTVDLKSAADIQDLQNYIFEGDFQNALRHAVDIPNILTTALFIIFTAAGMFILYGVWKLWKQAQEIRARNKLLEAAGTSRIVKGFQRDAAVLRNLEGLSAGNPLSEEVREIAKEQERRTLAEEGSKERQRAQQREKRNRMHHGKE